MKTLMSIDLIEEDGELQVMSRSAEISAADCDLLLRALGAVRKQLQPPVPIDPPANGSDLEIVQWPIGWFAGAAFPQGKVLGLRHPSFGWLAFQVPDEFADSLRQALEAVPQSYTNQSRTH